MLTKDLDAKGNYVEHAMQSIQLANTHLSNECLETYIIPYIQLADT